MKIVFDNIIFSLQKAGGISVVWYEILKRIVHDKNFELSFYEYNNVKNNIFREELALPNACIVESSSFALNFKRYLNLKISKEIEPFIFHSSYYRTCSNKNAINITTVHDFTYEKFRKGFKKLIHSTQKKNAILKSDAIICISENTKKDLLEFLPNIDSEKIHVIYNGVSDDYFRLIDKHLDKLPFPPNTFLIFVGSRDEDYKHFDFTVEVASAMKLNLVIVGGKALTNKETQFLNSKFKNENYCYLGHIDNQLLNILYNNAFCLFYPSVYEGFGLPVLEAQKAGCPVIAYNGSSVKEIIGNQLLLFDRFSVEDVTTIINNYLLNENSRNLIIENGLKNSEKFSWNFTYNKILSVYKLCYSQKISNKEMRVSNENHKC